MNEVGVATRFLTKRTLTLTDTGFLFDATDGESYGLTPVAISIVRQLEKARALQDVWELVAEEFDVSEEKARRDVLRFVEQLRIMGLVLEEGGRGRG